MNSFRPIVFVFKASLFIQFLRQMPYLFMCVLWQAFLFQEIGSFNLDDKILGCQIVFQSLFKIILLMFT